jgi:adenosylcobinamide-GDP ribazoletransferase
VEQRPASPLASLLASAPIALEFLTPLRLRRVAQWDDRTFGQGLAWYPAVGLLLGAVLLGLDRALGELLPPGPLAAVMGAALALLSGGLHLDGVADTADGMAVQGDRAQRLGVMAEGSVGPAGAMALAIVLIVQWSALASLADPLRSAGLVLAPALGRWTVAPVAALFPAARPRGLGHALQQGVWPLAAPVSALLVFGASLVLFGPAGLLLPLVAAAAALIIAWASSRMLNGVSGDTFGAAIEIAQAAALLALVAAASQGWLEPTFLE